jgi:HD superfamily phosphohydrolase
VVYRARQKERMQRAIKLTCPRDELRERQDSDQFAATWEAEVAVLAEVTHTRIAKIIDWGEALHPQGILPYTVMEYIEGVHMDEMWVRESVTGATFLALFDHVFDALDYLHGEGIMHCDVKAANVLVRRDSRGYSATLVDLGVAKVLKPFAEEEDEDGVSETPSLSAGAEAMPVSDELSDVTMFFSTARITRPEWQGLIEQQVPRAQIAEMFPGHDLYAFGKLLEQALESSNVAVAIERDLGKQALGAVETIRDRLLAPLGEEYYQTASSVRQDWAKLSPAYLSPLQIPELAVGASARTSLATPAGRVSITDRVFDIISHPLFQRLRNIPQLELASLVYPGASHSRLLHSLSIFDTTRRYVSHLLNDPNFLLLVERPQVEALLLQALLHDIGHYPLSHMFEDVSEEERLAGSPRLVPSDDELFWVFVAPEHAPDDFRDYADDLAEEMGRLGQPLLSAVLAGEGGAPPLVSPASMRAMQRTSQLAGPAECVLSGILSSPIDADKVAYLTDDSIMTGVRYGLGIDIDALLAALRAPRTDDITPGVRVIAIGDKGLTAAEGIVLARYWMLRRVYWHHTNRSTIAMTKLVIDRLVATDQLTMRDFFRKTLFADLPTALAWLSACFRQSH